MAQATLFHVCNIFLLFSIESTYGIPSETFAKPDAQPCDKFYALCDHKNPKSCMCSKYQTDGDLKCLFIKPFREYRCLPANPEDMAGIGNGNYSHLVSTTIEALTTDFPAMTNPPPSINQPKTPDVEIPLDGSVNFPPITKNPLDTTKFPPFPKPSHSGNVKPRKRPGKKRKRKRKNKKKRKNKNKQ